MPPSQSLTADRVGLCLGLDAIGPASSHGDRIVYWMHCSYRTFQNPALEAAIILSNRNGLPLDVLIVIDPALPDVNLRSFSFYLQGLEDIDQGLNSRGINLSVRNGDTVMEVLKHLKDASALVMDQGYLRHHLQWYKALQRDLEIPILQCEGNIVVPVRKASDKEEWSAATFRRKVSPRIPKNLQSIQEQQVHTKSRGLWDEGLEWRGQRWHFQRLNADEGTVDPSPKLFGGQQAAERILTDFMSGGFLCYKTSRNDPILQCCSELSPYLHLGQISPVHVALTVMEKGGENSEAFLEQLIIRRELAINYVNYNTNYDRYQGLPEWCRATLEKHSEDTREYVYGFSDLERGRTHDPYWNAAQRQMLSTGIMHNYMRMYWGKKILEWSETPQKAFEVALRLNNRYELDGRDANGYAGVAWCFGKHDRPWKERDIFGTIRYMNDKGLERKFDMLAYVQMTLDEKERIEQRISY